MTSSRRQHTAEQKVAILREHLLEGQAISEVCERHQIHPNLFYQWQRQFFENGTAAFEKPSRAVSREQETIQRLEEKLKQKDAVLAELLQEHVLLKKTLGGI